LEPPCVRPGLTRFPGGGGARTRGPGAARQGVARKGLRPFLLQRIVELTGCDPALVRHVDDRPGHDRRYAIDDTNLRALGWAPVRSFEDGLASTVDWYRDNRAVWEPIKSGDYRSYYERQYASRLAAE